MEENDGYDAAARQLRGGRAQRRRAAPVRRVRGDRAVQLPGGARRSNMAGAALIAGNTVVLQAVGGDALDRARSSARSRATPGCPPGVFNLVHGGPDTGRALVERRRGRRGLHRLGRGRPRDRPDAAGRAVRAPGAHRDGRQEPGDRDRQRRPRRGRRGRGARRPSGSRARSAAPARGRSWSTRCTTSSSSGSPPARPALSLGDPSDRDAFVGPGDQRGERGALRGAPSAAAARDGQRGRGRRARRTCPGHFVEPTVVAGLPRGHRARARRAVPAVRDRHARGLVRRGARRGQRARVRAHRRDLHARTSSEKERFLDDDRGRAWST